MPTHKVNLCYVQPWKSRPKHKVFLLIPVEKTFHHLICDATVKTKQVLRLLKNFNVQSSLGPIYIYYNNLRTLAAFLAKVKYVSQLYSTTFKIWVTISKIFLSCLTPRNPEFHSKLIWSNEYVYFNIKPVGVPLNTCTKWSFFFLFIKLTTFLEKAHESLEENGHVTGAEYLWNRSSC